MYSAIAHCALASTRADGVKPPGATGSRLVAFDSNACQLWERALAQGNSGA